MFSTRTFGFVVSSIAAAAVLTACSSEAGTHPSMPMSSASSAPAAPSTSAHNAADTAFAQQMIPHHQQAVEMAKMVPSRTKTPAVVALAQQIEQAQAPEIELMTGWLTQWASAPMAGMAGMPGMMSDADMAGLGKATGAAFDKQWLQMMIGHHQGAIDMANTELKQGTSPDAKQLAQKIVTGQQAEIATMRGLLG